MAPCSRTVSSASSVTPSCSTKNVKSASTDDGRSSSSAQDGPPRPSRQYYRWCAYGYSLLAVAMTAGLVFGWQSLRQHLQAHDDSLLSESTLGGVFTAGTWTTQACRLVFGMARDRWGCRRVTLVSLGCAALGILGLAWSSPNHALGLGVSLSLVGLGSGVQLCLQPVAALFPGHSGAIMASITGAFQVSALMFLILTKAANLTGLGRNGIFTAYAVLLGLLMVGAVLWVPSASTFVLGLPRATDGSSDTTDTKETAATDLSMDIMARQERNSPKKNAVKIGTTQEEEEDEEQVIRFMRDMDDDDEMETIDIAAGDQPTTLIAEDQPAHSMYPPPRPSASCANDKSTMAWVWESVWELDELESLESVPVASHRKDGEDRESLKEEGNGLILLLKDHHNIKSDGQSQEPAVQGITTSQPASLNHHDDAMMSGATMSRTSAWDETPTQPQHLLPRTTTRAPTTTAACTASVVALAPEVPPDHRLANLPLQTTRFEDYEDDASIVAGQEVEVGSSSPTWSVFQQKLDQRLHVLDQQLEANFEDLYERWNNFLDQRKGWAGVATTTSASLQGEFANHEASAVFEEPSKPALVVNQERPQDVQATAVASLSVSHSLSPTLSHTSYWDLECPPSPRAAPMSPDSELNLNDETETIFFEPDIVETPHSHLEGHLFPPDFHDCMSCGENDPTKKNETIASVKLNDNIPSSTDVADHWEWEAPRRNNSWTSSLPKDTITDDYDEILLMVAESNTPSEQGPTMVGQQEEEIDLENQQQGELEYLYNLPFDKDDANKEASAVIDDGVPSPSSILANWTAWESVWEVQSQASSTSSKTTTTSSGSAIVFEDMDAEPQQDCLFPPSFHSASPLDVSNVNQMSPGTMPLKSVLDLEANSSMLNTDFSNRVMEQKVLQDVKSTSLNRLNQFSTLSPGLHRMFSDLSKASNNASTWETMWAAETQDVPISESSKHVFADPDEMDTISFEDASHQNPQFPHEFNKSAIWSGKEANYNNCFPAFPHDKGEELPEIKTASRIKHQQNLLISDDSEIATTPKPGFPTREGPQEDQQKPFWLSLWSQHKWSTPPAFHDSEPGLHLTKQLRSSEYILLVTWFSVSVTPLQYYLGSLGFQLEHQAGSPDAAGFYIDLFSIMYACTAAASPLAGWVADIPQVGLCLSQLIATSLSVLSFVFLTLLDQLSLSAQLIGVACYCLGRLFTYSTFFAHVGKRFGYKNFGTLTGSGMLLGSIVSLFQLPMIVTASQGPSPARVINALSALMLVLVAVPFWGMKNK